MGWEGPGSGGAEEGVSCGGVEEGVVEGLEVGC